MTEDQKLFDEIANFNLVQELVKEENKKDEATLSVVEASVDPKKVAEQNIKLLIEKGMTSLNGLIGLANASDQPRAFEAIATLIQTLSKLNQDYIKVSATIPQDTPTNSNPESQTNIQNNTNVFVGSTADLMRAMQAINKSQAIENE